MGISQENTLPRLIENKRACEANGMGKKSQRRLGKRLSLNSRINKVCSALNSLDSGGPRRDGSCFLGNESSFASPVGCNSASSSLSVLRQALTG